MRPGYENEMVIPVLVFALALALTLPVLAVLRADRVPPVYAVVAAAGACLLCVVVWVRLLVRTREAEKRFKQLHDRSKNDRDDREQR
jgi:hypothetical protein